ncbi:hypothetical protein Cni_G27903 [Canna indica]|uniref:Uncharacterized protein n=1 Tax=Canna indica TaxID=4628 RepID=A0AAQ3L6F8_9LILI|nr:hypothetical protein Cni_G27903 [Canna indica]
MMFTHSDAVAASLDVSVPPSIRSIPCLHSDQDVITSFTASGVHQQCEKLQCAQNVDDKKESKANLLSPQSETEDLSADDNPRAGLALRKWSFASHFNGLKIFVFKMYGQKDRLIRKKLKA